MIYPRPTGLESVARLDWLGLPLLGGFLRWKRARLVLQLGMALLAALLVIEGLFDGEDVPALPKTIQM